MVEHSLPGPDGYSAIHRGGRSRATKGKEEDVFPLTVIKKSPCESQALPLTTLPNPQEFFHVLSMQSDRTLHCPLTYTEH